MARYRSIEEILAEEDELGLLNVTLRPRAARTPEGERDAELVREVNRFFERTGHVPDPEATGYEEMRLGILWAALRARGPAGDLADADPNGLLNGGPLALTAEPPPPERDWREEPDEDEVPASLDDIFDDDELDVSDAFTTIRHVTRRRTGWLRTTGPSSTPATISIGSGTCLRRRKQHLRRGSGRCVRSTSTRRSVLMRGPSSSARGS